MKTNAMRILEDENIEYNHLEYDISDDLVDGISVSKKINKDVSHVYKTLVTSGNDDYFVFVIPVAEELDLKKAAKTAKVKKIQMIHVKDIEKITGYIRGGCSPIGMKKEYKTFIQEDAILLDNFVVSAGKIGHQIEMNPEKLVNLIGGEFADLIK